MKILTTAAMLAMTNYLTTSKNSPPTGRHHGIEFTGLSFSGAYHPFINSLAKFIMKRITPMLALTLALPLIAQDQSPKPAKAKPVEILTAESKASVVTIIHGGRGEVKDGTGTGFAIGNNLIATCLHTCSQASFLHIFVIRAPFTRHHFLRLFGASWTW